MKKLIISFLIVVSSLQIVSCGEVSNENNNPTNIEERFDDKSMGKEPQMSDDVKSEVNKAYTDLQNEYELQKEKFDESKWDAYGDKFKENIDYIETKADVSYRDSVDYLRSLYSEYDNVLRGTIKEGESKITEIKNNIENAFK